MECALRVALFQVSLNRCRYSDAQWQQIWSKTEEGYRCTDHKKLRSPTLFICWPIGGKLATNGINGADAQLDKQCLEIHWHKCQLHWHDAIC
ncbi:hypothetical protein EJB05_40989, partial [Eragrostis curvula]